MSGEWKVVTRKAMEQRRAGVAYDIAKTQRSLDALKHQDSSFAEAHRVWLALLQGIRRVIDSHLTRLEDDPKPRNPRSKRGFQTWDPAKVKATATAGSHKVRNRHRFTPEERTRGGITSGKLRAQDPERLREIGRKGGRISKRRKAVVD